ncbi:MAG: hypothetical protein M0R46_16235 [Candidatus Muirbacterium halophilum]|nr:hypothetical protein [Candidatus Muirbacterium halophilum]MCK9477466.1 hypothetical protein [Candidatus Muirbacterium halophilum]
MTFTDVIDSVATWSGMSSNVVVAIGSSIAAIGLVAIFVAVRKRMKRSRRGYYR